MWTIPVLLTSSIIAHDTRVALTNTSDRLAHALESVDHWLALHPRIKLVLCDGSDFDFAAPIAQSHPDADVECISFANDQEAVLEHGRGFGEGEIVRYAINHSRLIIEAGAFAKCTSKLWVSNYEDCMAEWNGRFLCKGVFDDVFNPFRKTSLSYIDTRFYASSLEFYRQHFENAHLHIDVKAGKGLEDCFTDIVKRQKMQSILLSEPPVIDGVGGGIGKYYKNPYKRRVKEKIRAKIARSFSDYRTLFIHSD